MRPINAPTPLSINKTMRLIHTTKTSNKLFFNQFICQKSLLIVKAIKVESY